MSFEELQTERLVLRKLTPEIYDIIYATYSDSQLMDFLNLNSWETLEKEKEKHSKGLATHNRSFVYFKILDRQSNSIIGSCGFHTWYLDHFRAEIGYEVSDESFKRKGIMTEVLQTILSYGFDKMNLHRIEAFVGTDNVPSLKLMEKFGFLQEGHLREHYFKNGVMEDSLVFSLLRSEFLK